MLAVADNTLPCSVDQGTTSVILLASHENDDVFNTRRPTDRCKEMDLNLYEYVRAPCRDACRRAQADAHVHVHAQTYVYSSVFRSCLVYCILVMSQRLERQTWEWSRCMNNTVELMKTLVWNIGVQTAQADVETPYLVTPRAVLA